VGVFAFPSPRGAGAGARATPAPLASCLSIDAQRISRLHPLLLALLIRALALAPFLLLAHFLRPCQLSLLVGFRPRARLELSLADGASTDAPAEADLSYIKLIDVGKQMVVNRINGFLASRVMFFCANVHISPRPIWLTRHGESEFNVQGRIGGDSGLSPRGVAYSHRLAAFLNGLYPRGESELVVWTSTLRRTIATAAPLAQGREVVSWKALDEVDAGVCDGMTYEEIAAGMPEEYAARARNKFTYRYPRGESYQDMVTRLEPVLIELMRQKQPMLIVSHQATLVSR
jgi:broad specificity phosphatase PhoE